MFHRLESSDKPRRVAGAENKQAYMASSECEQVPGKERCALLQHFSSSVQLSSFQQRQGMNN